METARVEKLGERIEKLNEVLGLTAENMRKLGAAAEACRLSIEEFVRLTLVKDLDGRERNEPEHSCL